MTGVFNQSETELTTAATDALLGAICLVVAFAARRDADSGRLETSAVGGGVRVAVVRVVARGRGARPAS